MGLILVTLFSVVLESYKAFFVNSPQIELSDRDENNGKDPGKSIEKEDFCEKEKFFDPETASDAYLFTNSKYYLLHALSLPAPYTSLPEMPPERA